MNTKRRVIRIVGALLLGFTVAGAPTLAHAQHSFAGGGHSSGGGGHFSGGGHFGGGSAAHLGAPAHFGGAAVGGRVGGHFAATPGLIVGGPRFAAAPRAGAIFPHSAVHGSAPPARPGFATGGRGNWSTGDWHGGHGWHGWRDGDWDDWHGGWHGWHGGWWGGVFWPHVWFNPGFAWYLPVLPIGYATFWWGGVPYYYWNNLYYTWSPGDSGYVVTDPPPTADSASTGATDATDAGGSVEYATPPAQDGGAQPSGDSDVYVYPRNGQSEEQTRKDRYECHSWAVNQTGFDPTRPTQQSTGSAAGYRRAMIACLDARGYSAR